MNKCSKCNHINSADAKFCVKCGAGLANNCTNCNAVLAPGAKFCTVCGHKVSLTVEEDRHEGFVNNGEWVRAEGEFVKKFELNDMSGFFKSFGRQRVTVPMGCICAMMKDGVVTKVLSPGSQKALGWFEDFWSRITINNSRNRFYLIDKTPMAFFSTAKLSSGKETEDWRIMIQAEVKSNPTDIGQFLQRFVREKDSLFSKDLRAQLDARIKVLTEKLLEQYQNDAALAQEKMELELNEAFKDSGMIFGVTLMLEGTTTNIDLHLGQNEVPETTPCINSECSAELTRGMKFCTTCGTSQPRRESDTNQGEQRPLITSDGEHAELDLIVQFRGAGQLKPKLDELIDSIASVAARIISGVTYEELLSKSTFEKIEKAAEAEMQKIANAVNLRLTGATVLDVRSKSREWEMNARADINRVKKEMEINKEWLDIDSQQMDIERASLELVVKRSQMRTDHDFTMYKQKREDEIRRHAYDLEAERRKDEASLQDREARQDQADRSSDLDIADAQRDSQTNRAKREHEQADRLDALDKDTVFDRQQQQNRREDEQVQMQHEMNMENQSVAHDLNIQRQTMAFQSEQNRQQADDLDYSARQEIERNLHAQSGEQNLRQQDQAFTQNLEIDKLKAKQEMAMQMQNQQNDFAMKMEQMEIDAKRETLEKHSTMDAHQIMAASGRTLTDAEAQAMAAMGTGADRNAAEMAARDAANAEQNRQLQQEMYERMMAQQNQQAANSQQRSDAQQQQFMQMMQQMMAQQSQVQQANVQAMAQQAANTASQSRSVQEQSMAAMSNVAASRAQPTYGGMPMPGQVQAPFQQAPPTQSPPPAQQAAPTQNAEPQQPAATQSTPPAPKTMSNNCINCGFGLEPGAMFCPECGSKQA